MTNKYGIRAEIETRIRARDAVCVYCRKKMRAGNTKSRPTIEHLNNIPHYYDPKELTETDLAICCASCNTSRGAKHYWDWFNSPYCVERNITAQTVALVVKRYIKKYPKIRTFK